MTVVSIDRLKMLLNYNAETGEFVRIVQLGRSRAGSIAGSDHCQGYVHIQIDGKRYLAHRLAWFYVTGSWPTGEIDHADGNRKNNRMSNLRDVDSAINNQNIRTAKSNNRTGKLGVIPHRKSQFRARIQLDGKVKHLGTFDNKDSAHDAYLVAKRSIHLGSTI